MKSILYFALTALVLVSASPIKRTVVQVEADLNSINTAVTGLASAIKSFPNTGGSVANALAIHNEAVTLEGVLTKATTHVKSTTSGTVSAASATAILKQLTGIVPKIVDALTAVVAKKNAFQNLPINAVRGIVKNDLTNLQSNAKAFANALIAAEPAVPSIRSQGAALTAAVDAAFVTAVAAYA